MERDGGSEHKFFSLTGCLRRELHRELVCSLADTASIVESDDMTHFGTANISGIEIGRLARVTAPLTAQDAQLTAQC